MTPFYSRLPPFSQAAHLTVWIRTGSVLRHVEFPNEEVFCGPLPGEIIFACASPPSWPVPSLKEPDRAVPAIGIIFLF